MPRRAAGRVATRNRLADGHAAPHAAGGRLQRLQLTGFGKGGCSGTALSERVRVNRPSGWPPSCGPRVMLPRLASNADGANLMPRGRQLQRLVGQRRRRAFGSPRRSASIRQEGRHEPVRVPFYPGAVGRLRSRKQARLRSIHVGQ